MKDQPSAPKIAKAAPTSQEGAVPPWLPQARELATTCYSLATRASEIVSGHPLAGRPLEQTGKLLNGIGNHLENVINESRLLENSADPMALSLHLISVAKELPLASTKLWRADPVGNTADFSRTLPELSIALMSLSQHVTEGSPRSRAVVQCTI